MKYKKIPLTKKKFKKTRKVKLQWYHFVFPIIIFLIILIQIKLRLFQKNSFFMKNEPFKMRKKLPDYNFTDIIENYFMKLPEKFHGERDHELRIFRGYMKKYTLSEDGNSIADQRAKMTLYKRLGGERFSKLKNIFIKGDWRFGNRMLSLNNMIFYFELLKEHKNIYLNSNHEWFFKNKIVTKYVNISLANESEIDCNDNYTTCILGCPWLLTPTV